MLPPGATIGILGGGQLGRMLAQAAASLGFDVHVFTDEEDSPASRVCARTTVAAYDDLDALRAFARSVSVVTSEFENVPAASAEALVSAGVPVWPDPRALAVAQDRASEKSFLNAVDVPTVAFAEVNSPADLEAALTTIPPPAILKTRRFGYDGLGQARLLQREDAASAWEKIGDRPAVLEAFCPFTTEISVIAARTHDGALAFFDICENRHEGGILRSTLAPARIPPAVADAARAAAARVARALGYVGVLTIEFFLRDDGALIANEMAPRVHNSGHWTIEGAATSQFEQHIRAIAGWPLGPTAALGVCAMENLIGEDVTRWTALAAEPGTHLHLYGKRDARPGRKMGHVTRVRRE